MNVDQRLLRLRNVEQRIAACRRFAEARAECEQHVRILDALRERRIDAEAHIARIVRMLVVERVLKAECEADGQLPVFDERAQVLACLRRPATAACDHHRLFRAFQQGTQTFDLLRRRRRSHALIRGRRGHRLTCLAQHVFRQRQHDGTRPARCRRMERVAHVLGNATRVVDLRDPLRHLPEHASIVDFLERLAIEMLACALADQQDHRRGVLKRRVHADRCMRRARAARDDRHAGTARQLADGFSHVGSRRLVTAHDRLNSRGLVVQRIEHRQKTFAGHAEHALDAMRQQRVDDEPRAGGRI
jgi:hypothetical protein